MSASQPAGEPTVARSVRTLNRAEFDIACGNLMRMATSYNPTLLIGIRTGGLVVADAMAQSVAEAPPRVLPLTCRRPGTAMKSRVPLLHEVLGILPRDAVDVMRIWEHRLLSSRRKRLATVPHVDRDEVVAIASAVSETLEPQRLLVVDDAVDSGVTLATVIELLAANCPATVEIRSAVITVTLDTPRVMPDFALYRGVLCRFPWSFDASR